jgi:hypothetical protein
MGTIEIHKRIPSKTLDILAKDKEIEKYIVIGGRPRSSTSIQMMKVERKIVEKGNLRCTNGL